MIRRPPRAKLTDTLLPYTTRCRSDRLSPSRVRAITRWDRMYVFGPEPDYEPTEDKCVEVIAARSNRTRSEEHTSELQSLMRNSYAVFCMKKKTHHDPTDMNITHLHLTP